MKNKQPQLKQAILAKLSCLPTVTTHIEQGTLTEDEIRAIFSIFPNEIYVKENFLSPNSTHQQILSIVNVERNKYCIVLYCIVWEKALNTNSSDMFPNQPFLFNSDNLLIHID